MNGEKPLQPMLIHAMVEAFLFIATKLIPFAIGIKRRCFTSWNKLREATPFCSINMRDCALEKLALWFRGVDLSGIA